jgi:hypothetical protein
MAKFLMRTELDINEIKGVEEFKSLIPNNNQYDELKKSIKENGFLFPIIVNKNKEVIDGYTRLKIARELGVPKIPAEIYETGGREEELEMILNLNIRRRQLTKDEIIMLIDKVYEIKKRIRASRQITMTDDYIIIGDKKFPKLTNIFPSTSPNPEAGRQKYLFVYNETGSTSPDSNNSTPDDKNSGSPARNSTTSIEQNSNLTTPTERISGWTARNSTSPNEKNSITEESREIKGELKRLVPDIEINEDTIRKFLKVKEEAPWLINYIGDKNKGKIGIEKAYDIYRLLKKKNLLDLDKRVPENELNELVTDEYGRKVLERDDLLQKVLNKEMTVDGAINEIKNEEKGSNTIRKTEFGKVVEDLINKGYAELPFVILLAGINGKCYAINKEALSELDKRKDLSEFLLKNGIIEKGENENGFKIRYELLKGCSERV